ncbi:hypothetical protein QQ008_01660 [Fulvivirgaceae bacterium BMA10]|uniref:Integral membrane protein n=1 Tax=Splendidivirga corallicola TaxID=3051826 RepID=A0ABT8KH53_9BACT|nr:hypothetical protein [Fulvivirgaceae bacterium BMA10]
MDNSVIASSFIILSIICLIFIFRGVKIALARTALSENQQKNRMILFVGVIVSWMTFISIASFRGFFRDFNELPPKFLIILVVPLVIFIVTITVFSKPVNHLLHQISYGWLTIIQSFRIVVEILLWGLFVNGTIPIQLTFEGTNFDILVGLTAPVVYFMIKKNEGSGKTLLYIWNIAGLLILMNIVITAVLSTPTPFRVFHNEPANTIVTEFPYSWLPGILVPIAYTMHILSLKKLISERSADRVAQDNFVTSE